MDGLQIVEPEDRAGAQTGEAGALRYRGISSSWSLCVRLAGSGSLTGRRIDVLLLFQVWRRCFAARSTNR